MEVAVSFDLTTTSESFYRYLTVINSTVTQFDMMKNCKYMAIDVPELKHTKKLQNLTDD